MAIPAPGPGPGRYALSNCAGTRLTVTDAGAAVTSLVFRGTDVVLGWDDPAEYRRNITQFGATVGRCANRIAGARFTLGGREYTLSANDGPNSLHSGPDGYEARRWETAEVTESSVTFRLVSPHGDQGFPGRLELTAVYTLTEDDRVRLRYRAVSDADTVVNVTNHTYFNLNGHDAGDVGGHRLRLFAEAYTPAGPGQIPTGEIAPVEGTPFDFRETRRIGERVDGDHPQLRAAGGYDHNFCLPGSGLHPAAVLTGDRTGISLTVSTDRPGLQLYTANFLGGERGKGGVTYQRRGAVCLETQGWPDAVHREHFPSPVLRAGETFVSETVWALEQTGGF